MPFKFLPDVAIADIAFEAASDTLDGLLTTCAEAMTDIMVDPTSLRSKEERTISLEAEDQDRLLYDFLTELIILKDVDSLLFKDIAVKSSDEGRKMTATLRGEPIDRERHVLRNDVKAVTMHMFGVKHEAGAWKATVVLDI